MGLSYAEVAKKIKKDEQVVRQWEQGDLLPTFSQLEKLAYTVYKRPLAVFFLENPPVESTVNEDFRTLPETDITALSPEIRLSIRRAKYNQVVLKELHEGKNPAPNLLHKEFALSLEFDVVKSARSLRTYIGLDDLKSEFSNASDAFTVLRNKVQEKGVFVFQYPLKEVRGFSLMDREFPIVVVNSSDAPTAKNFTLFHELCHILFNTGGVFRNFVTDELLLASNKVERFCNAFASEVLMPAQEINARLQAYRAENAQPITEEKIRELASVFKVSKEVVLRRLLDLKLTDKSSYSQLTKRWNEQYKKLKDERRKKDGGPAYQTLVISHLGKKFVYDVLENYHAGRLDILRTAEFLGVKTNQVAKIEDKLY